MRTLVIYDIVEDKLRNKVANKCKDYGLTRIQYSAFFGELTTNRREELAMALRKILGRAWGRIHFFPMCDKDLRLMKIIDVGYAEADEQDE
ncbi:MAG: CRISPR-associated endonuclease Cas2 [Desulfitobacteriaceae bacterium]